MSGKSLDSWVNSFLLCSWNILFYFDWTIKANKQVAFSAPQLLSPSHLRAKISSKSWGKVDSSPSSRQRFPEAPTSKCSKDVQNKRFPVYCEGIMNIVWRKFHPQIFAEPAPFPILTPASPTGRHWALLSAGSWGEGINQFQAAGLLGRWDLHRQSPGEDEPASRYSTARLCSGEMGAVGTQRRGRSMRDGRDGSPLEGGGPELSCEGWVGPGWVEGSDHFSQWQKLGEGNSVPEAMRKLEVGSPHLLPSSPPSLHCHLPAYPWTYQGSSHLRAFALTIPSTWCPYSQIPTWHPSSQSLLKYHHQRGLPWPHCIPSPYIPLHLAIFLHCNKRKVYNVFNFYHLSPPLQCKLHEGKGFVLFPAILSMWSMISIYRMNEWEERRML